MDIENPFVRLLCVVIFAIAIILQFALHSVHKGRIQGELIGLGVAQYDSKTGDVVATDAFKEYLSKYSDNANEVSIQLGDEYFLSIAFEASAAPTVWKYLDDPQLDQYIAEGK